MRVIAHIVDTDDLPTNLGDRLTTLRRTFGLGQRDVAAAIGRSLLTISRWERGHCTPTRDSAQQLAQLYGIPIEILLADAMDGTV